MSEDKNTKKQSNKKKRNIYYALVGCFAGMVVAFFLKDTPFAYLVAVLFPVFFIYDVLGGVLGTKSLIGKERKKEWSFARIELIVTGSFYIGFMLLFTILKML
ncbi:MAG TPA: PigN domain-containing protein [Alphaproteobacteria bacterium]|nr:PigN domain-containing protein [Alphaproteobacteria bacterium]USO06069.1 MAG: PigN domain-containing protein [Rhodospirillales bacterium]HOO82688.1 PigN domain-containing protein [Alphaproteobacteria bacterium]